MDLYTYRIRKLHLWGTTVSGTYRTSFGTGGGPEDGERGLIPSTPARSLLLLGSHSQPLLQ
jgi:hypothetical protein